MPSRDGIRQELASTPRNLQLLPTLKTKTAAERLYPAPNLTVRSQNHRLKHRRKRVIFHEAPACEWTFNALLLSLAFILAVLLFLILFSDIVFLQSAHPGLQIVDNSCRYFDLLFLTTVGSTVVLSSYPRVGSVFSITKGWRAAFGKFSRSTSAATQKLT